MPTVIREEQDNGVIGKLQFLHLPNRAHAVVGTLDHGRIGRVLMPSVGFLASYFFFSSGLA